MRSTHHISKRFMMRWNNKIEESLGVRLGPRILVVIATIFVIILQILFLATLSSQPTHCVPSSPFERIRSNYGTDIETLPIIYVVTPTYARPVQRAELTRLSQTLMLVPRLHWIIVEDSISSTELVRKLVSRLKTKFEFTSITLLNEPTPEKYKLRPGDPDWKYPKGPWQRNKALEWLRWHNHELDTNGVVYFADDDNTYDLEIFDEMRSTRNVAVWPVGLVGGLLVERPIVFMDQTSNKSRVLGFNVRWEPSRRFPVDMAGFAVSVRSILTRPNAAFSCNERIGYMESHFLGQFVEVPAELEPKASDCRRILVWHTKTKSPALYAEKKLTRPSNSDMEII
uniref:Galactosylgalactosylxylosylprotein 3-beta-glucuronosyltransferase n=1 Tax=Aceria tosichella TaxID=561515 RepID=A0A6G1S9J3_9ACAR